MLLQSCGQEAEEVTFIDLRDHLDGVVLSGADEALNVVKVVLLHLLALSSSPLAKLAQFPRQACLDPLKRRLHDINEVRGVRVSEVLLKGS